MARPFQLQGHRGARGLKPENTLPAFEAALDLGVSAVETDVLLTADGVPVLVHDPLLDGRLCSLPGGAPVPVSRLTLAELRRLRFARNPDPARFSDQDPSVTPLARVFADRRGIDPYAAPTLAELFAFTAAYAGSLGRAAGKSAEQQTRATQVWFDLELKRVPFRPEAVGDAFDGDSPGLLEHRVAEAVCAAGVVARTAVRSFDHRSVRAVRRRDPRLAGAVLVGGTVPVDPAALVRAAGATTYCPDHVFLDELQVRELHEAGFAVIPWTVNDPDDWHRLIAWGVEGITTDFPDRLAAELRRLGIPY